MSKQLTLKILKVSYRDRNAKGCIVFGVQKTAIAAEITLLS